MHHLVKYHLTHLICFTSKFQSFENQIRVFLVYLDSCCIKSIKKIQTTDINKNKRQTILQHSL